MNDAIFVVLRVSNDTVETIGPTSARFASFEAADAFARSLSNRYTFQSFVVCRAVTAYSTQLSAMVTRVGPDRTPKPRQTKKAPKTQDVGVAAMQEDENVLHMPTRKIVAK